MLEFNDLKSHSSKLLHLPSTLYYHLGLQYKPVVYRVELRRLSGLYVRSDLRLPILYHRLRAERLFRNLGRWKGFKKKI